MQTRLYYDTDEVVSRDAASKKAMKWYTTDTQQNRVLEYGHPNDISIGTNLSRGMATRCTDKDQMNTELFGTAPYLYLRTGNNNQIDVESELLHKLGDGVNSCDRKPLYSESYYGPHIPIVVESQRAGVSSRNERIVYGSKK
jgi:hypothetical protein